ncbi:MAG: hypothetical protein LBP38_09480 [Desulfovibrio sp.]|jgi:hypothetical protein|nr:hypothetical protein [Desulfovibrio sp.]
MFETLVGGNVDTITDFEYGKDHLSFSDLLSGTDELNALFSDLSLNDWQSETHTLQLTLGTYGNLAAEFSSDSLILTITQTQTEGGESTDIINVTFNNTEGSEAYTIPTSHDDAAEILKTMLENYQG